MRANAPQSEAVQLAIRALMSGGPVICFLAGTWRRTPS
jgi:hypothetical protein